MPSTMEECSDKNHVNSAMTASSSLNFKENFYRKLVEYDEQHKGSHRKSWTLERILEVINDLKKAQVSMSSGQRRTPMDYYWMSKYDIMTIENEDCLIYKRLTATAPTLRILPREQYFDVLSDIHTSCGHGGRDKILFYIKNKYYIPKKAVEIFVSLCPICKTKRKTPRKSILTKPIISRDFNLRGQVNLVDFQSCPDGEFKWLLNYEDNASKFLNLRPLKTKGAVEVASELMKIFLIFGAPYILQSDNGREFTANVIKELVAIWPECKIVHGNSCHPQTQGNVQRSNQDIENILRAWMTENKSTNWSVGCFFVQHIKNASFHRIIGRSPFNALFGIEPKVGLNGSDIPMSILSTIETEEQLNTFIEGEPAEANNSDYENNDNNSKTVMENIENFESNITCAVCDNDATGEHNSAACKQRWQCLRDAYRRALNKRKGKVGLPAKQVKHWKYDDEMAFVAPYLVQRKSKEYVENLSEDGDSNNGEEHAIDPIASEHLMSFEGDDTAPVDDSDSNCTRNSDEEVNQNNTHQNRTDKKSIAAKRKADESQQESASPKCIKLLNDQTTRGHDELDRFFLTISDTVKKLTPYQQALAKNKIFTLVSEMELMQYAPHSSTVYTYNPPETDPGFGLGGANYSLKPE